MRQSLTANQYVREHDRDILLSTLQELALRFQGVSNQREIVGQALDWAAQLGVSVAFLHPQLDSALFSVDATAGCEEQAQRALQAAAFAASEDSLPGYALVYQRTVLVADTLADERFAELPSLAHTIGFRVALAIPLIVQERCRGVLLCLATTADLIGPATVGLLEVLAGQMALALEHARRTADLAVREALIEQRHAHLRRAYDLVAAERRTLAAVLDSVSDAVLVIDVHGMVQLGNPAIETVLGIHPDLLIGHLLHQTDVPERLVALAQQARAARGEHSGELALPDGRVFHVSFAPVQTFDGPVQGYVTLLKDITYFKRLDEMKSHFVATVSHDFKSPLNIISGYAELLGLVGPLNQEQAEYVGQIMRSVRQLSGMVTNLLDLGRIEAGVGIPMRPCDLGTILRATVESYRLMAIEKRINLTIQPHHDLPPIWGDETHLQQIVGNLVSNALTYTPQSGSVRIWPEVAEEALVVRVQDSGIGIPPGDLPYIFDPFFRAGVAKEVNSEGTGLGLAIVKRIVEEHGGSVGVESALGVGSTFWFRLPTVPHNISAI